LQVLEWVENTAAFIDFIVDSAKGKVAGAHSRYSYAMSSSSLSSEDLYRC
jgi:hypothetical protein